jgi:hypothetical protein
MNVRRETWNPNNIPPTPQHSNPPSPPGRRVGVWTPRQIRFGSYATGPDQQQVRRCPLCPTNDLTRGSWIRRGLDQGACPPARSTGEHSAETKSQKTRSASARIRIARATCFERFFNKIKQCRRIATRYDKLAANYLAFVKLASIRIWLRANEPTP